MKVLVTGATGFIGSHIADLLLEKGYEVRCTYRKTSNLQWLEGKPFDLVEADFFDIESLKNACKNVDYIIHSAGVVAGWNLDDFIRGNRDTTLNLLKAATEVTPNLKKFIYVSSQTAAGPAESLDKPVTEDMPPHPITSYGKSKIEAEESVKSFKNSFNYVILRPTAVYGPRDVAIFQMFQVAQKGLGTLMGFNKKYLNLIHGYDCARGIVQALESDNAINETYFIASEEIYNWPQIISVFKKTLNKKFFVTLRLPHFIIYTVAFFSEFFGKFAKKPPVFNKDKAKDFVQKYWICSVEKAKNEFGFKQEISLEEGIKQTFNWYKKHDWL